MKKQIGVLIVLIWLALLLSGCGNGGKRNNAAATPYTVTIDPTNFVAHIDNPYLPFTPGTTLVYEGATEDGTERVEVTTLSETRQVMGVTVTIVRDIVYLDGVMVEDTYDWFAQDKQGNVWYFGEEVANYEDGILVDHEGAWMAGEGGALPGIVMYAQPSAHIGTAYFQEYDPGEAEDMGEVMRVGETMTVPFGSFADVVQTKDWTPLEPKALEHKFYAPGVGLIKELDVNSGETIELIEVRTGS